MLRVHWNLRVAAPLFASVLSLSLALPATAQDAAVEAKPAAPQATAAPVPAGSPEDAPHQTVDSSLHLGIGDLLEFSVYNVPELSTKTRVGSNGDIYLPLIDYVHVAGLTPEEAQTLIEKRYCRRRVSEEPARDFVYQ